MADLENKKANNPETKKVKKKSDKPSIWSRIAAFARSIKSEVKKISWSPWTEVRKNTLVVVVVIAVCAIGMAIVDYVFLQGITALGNLF
ncbi:MAG: preprotein translocase subunit SecE [Clostridia bacterium]|nr:preprotein translocase subunit SecE [Clostridia bacterium]MBR3845748.1 preprotein translocase subunit SecE [Clostridia bacterium]